jgi:hypothetical protein
MARATLASIITLVRGLINDPSSVQFTDDQIQSALDLRRDEARYIKMTEKPSIVAGGQVRWLIFDAPCMVWEDGATIVDQGFRPLDSVAGAWVSFTDITTGVLGVGNQLDTTVSPNPDLYNGRWVLGNGVLGQPHYPVMLTGFTHDIYGAAADLLREWAVTLSLSFDVKADGTELIRSQKAAMLTTRANEYLAKARMRSSDLIRTDETQNPHLTYDDGYPNSRVNP